MWFNYSIGAMCPEKKYPDLTTLTVFTVVHLFIFLPDKFDGLSKYSIVHPQVIQRLTRSISKPKQSQEVGKQP